MLPEAFNRLRTLSFEYEEPTIAFRLMRDFMEKSIKNTKANAVKDTTVKFNKTGVVFKDVNDTAISLTAKMKNGSKKEYAKEKINKNEFTFLRGDNGMQIIVCKH